ncbi:D-amino-acid transaminase [Tenuibacillus multivorans]|uniref:D-alanine aminotransferase n=1 Tax=Tenuibacillus multivorans TaxID=237069 RepID=A0A1H0A0X3_9BACI|nr:D-amino-acid transaminase [Tenuibacillus multivorans]GEL76907.1 D-alanine aminotransferase [Tenuibacillus multivorans]SDN26583.1 D-alanine transaminase [Tenuibacillus multivorans]
MFVLLNNKFIDRQDSLIDIEDRGNQFGDGVYEVFRIYDGEYFLLDDHLKRLEFSLKETQIDYNLNQSKLKDQLLTLAQKNDVVDGGIYLQISRGSAARNHPFPEQTTPTVLAYPIPVTQPKEQQQNGIQATLYQDIRWLRCDIKSLNLLGNVMAKQHALDYGVNEAIFYRDKDHVTEGSSCNVFIVRDGVIQTHPANNYILNGITRLYIQYLAKQLDIPIKEEVFSVDELKQADEVFISSTTSEVISVIDIDGQTIGDGQPGPVAQQLLDAFFDHKDIQQLP